VRKNRIIEIHLSQDKEYLFPGTAFLKRIVILSTIMHKLKLWFLDAEKAEAEGESGCTFSL